jgi:hypothetical protein
MTAGAEEIRAPGARTKVLEPLRALLFGRTARATGTRQALTTDADRVRRQIGPPNMHCLGASTRSSSL